jgi:hypothetical protein
MYTLDEGAPGEAEARARMAAASQAGLADVSAPAAPAAAETPAATAVPAGLSAAEPERAATTPFGMSAPEFTHGMLSAFKNPDVLIKLGELAVKYQQPQFLDYLQKGWAAQKENAGTAVMKLIGGDTQGAMQAFNASGQHKATSIVPNGDGTYNIALTGPDGQPYVRKMDPHKEMLSFLTPPQYIAHADREGQLRAKEEAIANQARAVDVKAQVQRDIADMRERYQKELISLGQQKAEDNFNYRSGLIDAKMAALGQASQNMGLKTDLLQAKIDLANSQAGLADARGAAVDAGGTGNVGNRNTINAQIMTAAKSNSYVITKDAMGKDRVDAGKANQVAAIAQYLVNKDPQTYGRAPANTVAAAVEKLKQIQQQVQGIVETQAAETAAQEPLIGRDKFWREQAVANVGGQRVPVKATGLADYKTKLSDMLTSQAIAGAGVAPPALPGAQPGGSRLVSGAIGQAPAASASAAPATPKTAEEYAKLPPGTIYIDPASGQYKKKQ